MRRTVRIVILCAVFAALLSGSALADENAARAERGEGPLMRSDGTELKIGK